MKFDLQSEVARERRGAFSKIWEPFSSRETMALLKEILLVQSMAE